MRNPYDPRRRDIRLVPLPLLGPSDEAWLVRVEALRARLISEIREQMGRRPEAPAGPVLCRQVTRLLAEARRAFKGDPARSMLPRFGGRSASLGDLASVLAGLGAAIASRRDREQELLDELEGRRHPR